MCDVELELEYWVDSKDAPPPDVGVLSEAVAITFIWQEQPEGIREDEPERRVTGKSVDAVLTVRVYAPQKLVSMSEERISSQRQLSWLQTMDTATIAIALEAGAEVLETELSSFIELTMDDGFEDWLSERNLPMLNGGWALMKTSRAALDSWVARSGSDQSRDVDSDFLRQSTKRTDKR